MATHDAAPSSGAAGEVRRTSSGKVFPIAILAIGGLAMVLGLAAALQAVRLHDGDIRVASAPGEGSCFSIVLPRETIDSSRND